MALHSLEKANPSQWHISAPTRNAGLHRAAAATAETVVTSSEYDVLPPAKLGPATIEAFNTIVAGLEVDVKRPSHLQKLRTALGSAAIFIKKVTEEPATARTYAEQNFSGKLVLTETNNSPELDSDTAAAVIEAQAIVYHGISLAKQREYARIKKYEENNLTDAGESPRPMVRLFTHDLYTSLEPQAIAIENTRTVALVRGKLDATLAKKAPGEFVDEHIAPTKNYSPDYIAQVLST